MSQKIKEAIILTAAFYNYNLKPEVLLMHVEDLSEHKEQDVLIAYNKYRKDPKNKSMPLPAQIVDIISPTVTDESKARDLAAKISESIVRFGYSNAEAAKNYVGSLGWELVRRSGGWSYLCSEHGLTINPSSFDAQIRNRALDAIRFGPSLGFDIVKEIEYSPKGEIEIQAEIQRQKIDFYKHNIKEEPKNIENEKYLSLSNDQRQEKLKVFIDKFKSKTGETNGV